MKRKYQRIWKLALPYQDARDDVGHGEIVTYFAEKLCSVEKVNKDIVIPAAILHDIGWSRLSKEERFVIFDKSNSAESSFNARLKHQEEGVKLAREILSKVNYKSELVDAILSIISEHDTREGYLTKEEAVMRDADKLWRVSKIGFYDDIRQSKITAKYYYDLLVNKIDSKDFLFLESSRKIARAELELRLNEFSKK